MSEFEKRLACVIRADGTTARGHMVDTCEFDGINNKYTIGWGTPLQGVAKTNFAATVGSVLDEPVAPGLITVGPTGFGAIPAQTQQRSLNRLRASPPCSP